MRRTVSDDIKDEAEKAVARAGYGAKNRAKAAVAEFGYGTKLAYSIDGLAIAADLGRTTLYNQIASGHLKARKVGNRTLILAEDARAFLLGLPKLEAA